MNLKQSSLIDFQPQLLKMGWMHQEHQVREEDTLSLCKFTEETCMADCAAVVGIEVGKKGLLTGKRNPLLRNQKKETQRAMDRLEAEFVNLLTQYKQQPLELDHMSFRSSEDDLLPSDDFSSFLFDDEANHGKIRNESSWSSKYFEVDLIHLSVVSNLRIIAETMLVYKYDKECSKAYIGVRKDAIDECLSSVFHIKKLSIDEVMQMDWESLNSMIKRWNHALKIFIRVYLSSEIRLCDLIFKDFSKSWRQSCFHEISKSSIMLFLNLGEAISFGPLKPEKIYRILDMYECLTSILADIELLFPTASGSILDECGKVLSKLGERAIGILHEFVSTIRRNMLMTGLAGGGVHSVTRYVMNYIKPLTDYSGTLNMLLPEEDSDSPIAAIFHSITSILESNLADRSMLHDDKALQNIFMMNSICYMVQKAKDSDLQNVLGDDWSRSMSRKLRQHATSYERASWNPVLSFLKDDGICNHGSNVPSKTVLKERFKSFNQALEEVYRNQTVWYVPNVDLREDLKISISVKVLQAYWTFMGRYSSHMDVVRHRGHYIKYYLEDLELALLDLFEGTPKEMHPLRR